MLPDAPNLLTIGADGSTAETVLMTAKNGNVLTVVRGQDGTTARAWSAGDVIGRYFTAADQKAMQDNITALNNGKTEKVSSPVSGNLVAFDGTTGKQKDSGKKPGDFAAAQPFTQRVCAGAYFPECQRCSVRVEQRQHVCSIPRYAATAGADGRDRKPRAGGYVRGNGSRIRHLRARRAVRQRYGQNLRRVETGGGDHAAIYFVH